MRFFFVYVYYFAFVGMSAQAYQVTYLKMFNIEKQLKDVTEVGDKKILRKQLSVPTYFTLQYKDGKSIYKLAVEKKNKDFKEDAHVESIDIFDKDVIYKDTKKAEYINESNLLGRKFLVVDLLEPIKWDLINEEKKIGNFICKKAVYEDGIQGKVEAWYTTKIPVPDGPGSYYGLPGLIIELKTDYLTYNVEKVSNKNDVKIEKPNTGRKINKKEFEKIRQEGFPELESNI